MGAHLAARYSLLSVICSRSISRSAPRTRTSHLAPRASYPIRSAPPLHHHQLPQLLTASTTHCFPATARFAAPAQPAPPRTSHLPPPTSYPIRSAPPTASPPTPTTSYNFYNLLLPCHDLICCTCTTRTTLHLAPRTMHLPPRTSSCPSPPPATPGTCSFLSEQVVVKTTDLLHLHNPICCTQPGVEPNLYSRQQHSCEHELSARSPALKIFSRASVDRALTDNF